MFRLSVLLLAAAVCALPARAQSDREMRAGRDRTWDSAQVERWLNYHASRRMVRQPSLECPDETARRDAIMNGNKITTQITNFGSISAPNNSITDIVWNGLGYGYEFGPFVAAEIVDVGHQDPQSVQKRDENGNVVLDENGQPVWVMHIVSDGLVSNGGEISPNGGEYWGWHPIPCAQPVGTFGGIQVVNPTSDRIPTSDDLDRDLDGKPDSWPAEWYNPTIGRYVWPGALQQGSSNADKEALYFMNDYANVEFAYQPFPSDPTKRGLGLEVETRMYQWSNPLAEDAIFLVYKITNKSEKDLEKVIFGMWGDPHIGGINNWQDDLAFFDRDLNIVYAYDSDGKSDVAGRVPGYFGYKFLESPGIGTETIGGVTYPGDGIDNDGDGMVDESWTDGIDNDNDWNAELDDVGIDGVPGTGDPGELDGRPTAGDPFDITKPGEPNFEFTDIDESDMLGLTSFASPPFAGNRVSNDERVWDLVRPGRFDEIPAEAGDYVFLYGSGSFPLRAGETKRFSIALLVGENLNDLKLNAQTVQQIYDVGYRFAQAPRKPLVTAVPGDGKVTLYWEDRAERSVDPLTKETDFEGYVIYRSTDPLFNEIQTITDINGSRFLYKPLKNAQGAEAKFDIANGLKGVSPIPFAGRGVSYDLGEDTGLYHSYVDSNNVINGKKYYYAVVSYDRGYAGNAGAGFEGGIPPSESSKTITHDPWTDTYVFDDNTVSVTPGPRVAGYVPPALIGEDGIRHTSGFGTGDVRLEIIDEFAVENDNAYRVEFDEVDGKMVYSIIDEKPITIRLPAAPGTTAGLRHAHVDSTTFQLQTLSGSTLQKGRDYEMNPAVGNFTLMPGAAVSAGDTLLATFTYAPVYRSSLMNDEEANPVFDGMKLFVNADALALNKEATGWTSSTNIPFEARLATAGPRPTPLPYDYEIRFADSNVSTSLGSRLPLPFTAVNVTRANDPVSLFVPDPNLNGVWDLDEPIILIDSVGSSISAVWQVTFSAAGGASKPGAGSVFYFKTRKPFTGADAFAFSTVAARAAAEEESAALGDIYVVPNPYVATNEFEPNNPISTTERGERRLYFANVPQQCTIRIYTLSGELVDTIEHNGALSDGKAFWDLRTKDNMNISYGLYLFQVESDRGTFIGKFAVIK